MIYRKLNAERSENPPVHESFWRPKDNFIKKITLRAFVRCAMGKFTNFREYQYGTNRKGCRYHTYLPSTLKGSKFHVSAPKASNLIDSTPHLQSSEGRNYLVKYARSLLIRLGDRTINASLKARRAAPPQHSNDLIQKNVTTTLTSQEIDVDVKEIRESLGLSQAEFADVFGIPIATLRNWEQGRRKPDVAVCLLLRLIKNNPAGIAEEIKNIKNQTALA